MMMMPDYSTSVLTNFDITPPAIVRAVAHYASASSLLLPQADCLPRSVENTPSRLIENGLMAVRTLAILPVDPAADRIMAEWIAEQPAPTPRKALTRKRA